jgi:hypothetical protein
VPNESKVWFITGSSKGFGHIWAAEATGPAILEIVDAAEPPLRVFLGDGPLAMIKDEYANRIATWERWNDLSVRAHGEPSQGWRLPTGT